MAKVENVGKLLAELRRMAARALNEDEPTVAVGYEAAYALRVHEDLEAYHPNGQAKYLEQPARELSGSGELAAIVRAAKKRGATTEQALLLAGLRLQRDSQELVPVDTGNLRASAFTRVEE